LSESDASAGHATREPQYQRCLDLREQKGLTRLGLMSNQTWNDDPKRLLFVLSRYKFVAKMMRGRRNILEVGCADAFGTRIVLQETGNVTAVDFDPVFIDDVNARMDADWKIDARVHDILEGAVAGSFDGVYALDVLEHIQPSDEDRFISNMRDSITADGLCIIGSPSLQSQTYASEWSRAGHVNCKDEPGLRIALGRFFTSVLTFSMNDEVVHTGFYPMANYLLAVCHGRR
jgi:2-polyprenyl-3-methyl-5-hydroxy-6-metoxy-1,4-benzoquinol methylase